MDFKILKSRNAPSKKFEVKWDSNNLSFDTDVPSKKPKTREEEADEIIRRLSTTPRRRTTGQTLQEEIMLIIARSISDEIDREVLGCLKKK